MPAAAVPGSGWQMGEGREVFAAVYLIEERWVCVMGWVALRWDGEGQHPMWDD